MGADRAFRLRRSRFATTQTLQRTKVRRNAFQAMKAISAISFGMALRRRGKSKRKEKSKPPRLVSAEWGKQLRDAADAAGIGWEKVCQTADVSIPTAWRVTNGEGTVRAARDLRLALEKLGGPLMPDPIPVSPTGDLAEWNELGKQLFLYPSDFTRVVGQLREALSLAEKARSAMAVIRKPIQPTRHIETDDEP